MSFLTGAFTFNATVADVTAIGKVEYDTAVNKHQVNYSLMIDGVVREFSRTSDLRLNGKRRLHRLPIRLSITSGEPGVWDDPTERQTHTYAEDHIGIDAVTERIGNLSFIGAYEDRELSIKEDDSLWADIVLPELMFADMWTWVRSGARMKSISFDVYGEAMQKVHDYTTVMYHWIAKDDTGFGSFLYMTNFTYSFAREGD